MSFSLPEKELKELGFVSKKRRSITKKERSLIASKTNNKCGYCGVDLPCRWHVDHIEPFAKESSKCALDNFMASCPQCNNFKHSHTLERFRSELSVQVLRAREYSVNFRLAEKYGQIEIINKPIVFYFEILSEVNNE